MSRTSTPGVTLSLIVTALLALGAGSVQADVNCDRLPVSIGPVPPEVAAACGHQSKSAVTRTEGTSDLAYSVGADANLYSMVLDTPEELTTIASGVPVPTFINAVEFGNDGTFAELLVLDMGGTFFSLDTADGTYTAIGTAAAFGGESFTGLATDPTDGTLYACSTNLGASSLYEIDPASGASTRVGAITNEPGMIGIAIDAGGQMYGYGLINDSLLEIDKATGAGTIVGPLGFDANYGQGMDFDESDGTLYLFAYNNSAGQPQLLSCDTATGATTLVGVLGAVTPGGSTQLGSGAVGTGGLQVGAELSADKEVAGDLVPGGTVTYTIGIANDGPDDQPDDPASDEFEDTLPGELTLTGAAVLSGGGTVGIAGNTVTWNGSINAGSTIDLEITATINLGVAPGTVVTNQGTIRWDSDADGDNDSEGVTDDPELADADDATEFEVAAGAENAIPALDGLGLLVMISLLTMVAVLKLRRS